MAATVLNILMPSIFLLLYFRGGEHILGLTSTSGLYVWFEIAAIPICLLKCLVVRGLCWDIPPVSVRINFALPCNQFMCVLRRVVWVSCSVSVSQRGTLVKLAGSQLTSCNAAMHSAESDLLLLPSVANDILLVTSFIWPWHLLIQSIGHWLGLHYSPDRNPHSTLFGCSIWDIVRR
jgi:hypothetical protein